jgi:PKD repeat protein
MSAGRFQPYDTDQIPSDIPGETCNVLFAQNALFGSDPLRGRSASLGRSLAELTQESRVAAIVRFPFVRRGPRSLAGSSSGQGVVELALVLPVFLLIVLIGVDFGRVYSGWVTLQQASRIAADYAAENWKAWQGVGIPSQRSAYQALVRNETAGINCDLPDPVPDPVFNPGGDGVLGPGDSARVDLDCDFHILTPIVSAVLPNPLKTSAGSTFPIKTGPPSSWGGPGSSAPPCAGAGTCPQPPIANFSTLPVQSPPPITTANSGQNIQFNDSSQQVPTSWNWNFGDSTSSSDEFPIHAYVNNGPTTVTYSVTQTACNLGGCSTATGTIHVLAALQTPVAGFHWCTSSVSTCSPQDPSPLIGQISVWFFDDSNATAATYAWSWSDGGTSTAQNPPAHVYAQVATSTIRTITLTVTNASGSSTSTLQITIDPPCLRTAPHFANTNNPFNTAGGPNKNKWTTSDVFTVWTNTAAQYNADHPGSNYSWTGGGFSTSSTINYNTTPGAYFTVTSQTPTGGTQNLSCNTTLNLTLG